MYWLNLFLKSKWRCGLIIFKTKKNNLLQLMLILKVQPVYILKFDSYGFKLYRCLRIVTVFLSWPYQTRLFGSFCHLMLSIIGYWTFYCSQLDTSYVISGYVLTKRSYHFIYTKKCQTINNYWLPVYALNVFMSNFQNPLISL